jgi:hypothetical protein
MAASVAQQNQAAYSTPTELVSLPSEGKFYPPEHPLFNKDTIEIKIMTTKEEDILATPSFIEKGVVIDKLLESIIVDKRIRPESLLIGDRTAVLFKARISAYGPEYTFNTVCQSCSTQQKVEHLFEDVKNKEIKTYEEIEVEDGLIKMTLPRSKAVVHIKLLTGQDENEIDQEKNRRKKANLPEESVMLMYKKMIVKVNDNQDYFAIANFISEMPIADSRYIRKIYQETKPDVDLTYRFECKKCGHVDDGGVVSFSGDFFWPRV